MVEDQVTYPLTTAMLTVPKSRVVRGFSYFGVSFVYVIFEDGTDIYWARSRVLEYLNAAARKLPSGVTPTLGPDATGVGWVYQYALLAKDRSLAELRSLQDWSLRYGLSKAEGVAEIASVGGFVKQYNVVIDPQRLRSFGIPLSKVRDAIRASNMDVGGRTVELSEFEFVVRGRGYLKGIPDLRNIVLKNDGGTPVLLQDVARVELGPDERRGLTELNGDGEVASGIVLQRFGANALDVIDNVKKRMAELAGSLPKGVEIQPVYDRSTLIHAAIETLRHTLLEESAHRRAGLRRLPAARAQRPRRDPDAPGRRAHGFCRDEAAGPRLEHHEPRRHRHRDRRDGRRGDRHDRKRAQASRTRAAGQRRALEILIEAATEVGPALFFSLLIITVSFLPIFTLEAQEGRLFSPLAYTKTFSMAAAALLSMTLVPALMVDLRARPDHSRAQEPAESVLIWLYRPVIKAVLKAKTLTVLLALGVAGRHAVAGAAARHRIHADPQ